MKLRHWFPLLLTSTLALSSALSLAHAADCVPTLDSRSRVFIGCGFGYARIVSRINKEPAALTRRERDKIRLGHASLKEGFYNLITGIDKLDAMNGFPGSFVAKLTFSGFPYTAFVEFADSYSATAFVADIRAGGKHVDLSNCSNEIAGLVCSKGDPAPSTFAELDFYGYSVRIWDGSYGYDIRGKQLMTPAELTALSEGETLDSVPSERAPASQYKKKGAAALSNSANPANSDEEKGRIAPGAPLGL